MTACPNCGAKPRKGRLQHDRSCPARFLATSEIGVTASPLHPNSPVPELTNLYDDNQLVPWLAFVGLGGRWCWAGQNMWLRWDGKKWKRTKVEHVREAVRRALTSLHERTDLPGREHLLTIQRMTSLREQMRVVVAVDASSVGVER